MIIQKIIFTENECNHIIDLQKSNHTDWGFRNDRKYQSYSIFCEDSTKWIFNKLHEFFEETTNLKIKKLKPEIHYHTYKNGDWFSLHNDNTNNRLYSVGVLLNENYEGGDFLIYDNEKNILNKNTGNSYIFNSELEHEIKPIIKGERYSLIWFLEKDNLETKTNKVI